MPPWTRERAALVHRLFLDSLLDMMQQRQKVMA